MIELAQSPQRPDGLLVWNYARFARDMDDSAFYRALIRKKGMVIFGTFFTNKTYLDIGRCGKVEIENHHPPWWIKQPGMQYNIPMYATTDFLPCLRKLVKNETDSLWQSMGRQ
jgi:hypothetical protein